MADYMAVSKPPGFTSATGKSLLPDALLTTELVWMLALCSARGVTSKLWRSQRSYWECCGMWADVGVWVVPGLGCPWCNFWQLKQLLTAATGTGHTGHRERAHGAAGGLSRGFWTAQRGRGWWHEDFDVDVGYCGRGQRSLATEKRPEVLILEKSLCWVCIKHKSAENPLSIQR